MRLPSAARWALRARSAPTPAPLSFTSGVLRETTVDVTSYITGNGTYNLAFSTTSSTNVSYSSREGANAPQLVIETSTGATNTPTATATSTTGPSPTPTRTPTGVATSTSTLPPTVTPTTPPPFQSASFLYDGDGKWVESTVGYKAYTVIDNTCPFIVLWSWRGKRARPR